MWKHRLCFSNLFGIFLEGTTSSNSPRRKNALLDFPDFEGDVQVDVIRKHTFKT